MRAGLLNEVIEVWKPTIVINSTGEQTTTYTLSLSIRARVVNNSNNRTVENSEVYYPHTKQLQVRIYQNIDEFDRIKFNGKFHRILSIEPDKLLQCKNIEMEEINE